MSDAIPDEDEEYRLYDIAATIAHDTIKGMPERILEAGGDPMGGAYELWSTFTGILLQNGWTACDLAEAAHELMDDMREKGELDDEDEPEAVH